VGQARHLLVIRLSAMGDVAMTVPVLKALTHQNDELKITVLSQAMFAPLFDNINNVEFVTADIKGNHKGIFGLYKLAKAINRLEIEEVADLHNVLRSKILRRFLGLRKRKFAVIDKGRSEKAKLIANRTKSIKPLKTTHERYADVFRSLGYTIDLKSTNQLNRLDLPPNIGELIRNGTKKWVGIAPFAKHKPKTYPFNQTQKVIEYLSKKDEIKIFLFGGGADEIKVLESIVFKLENVISVAGKFSFREELRLISNLDAMISMDSANGHLAALFGVKTLTLWGATHPYAGFAPLYQPSENQLFPDPIKFPNLPSSVFGKSTFKGYENAMNSITPELVVKTLEKIMI